MKRRIILVSAMLSACGDGAAPCDLDRPGEMSRACQDAVIVSLRESNRLSPAPVDVAATLEVIEAGRPVACELRSAYAIYDYNGDYLRPTVITTNPVIVDAWSAGTVITGSPEVDALFQARGAVEVAPAGENRFSVRFVQPVSHRVLAEEVATLAQTTVDLEDYVGNPNDIRRVSTDTGWLVSYVIGWGDCFSGCPSHEWVVSVTESLDAELVEERGDAVPSAVSATLCE